MTLHFLISAPVFMQVEMRDLASHTAVKTRSCRRAISHFSTAGFLFGIPGFGSVIAILWLTIVQTALGRHERR
jgi:uncharacterized membrane protein